VRRENRQLTRRLAAPFVLCLLLLAASVSGCGGGSSGASEDGADSNGHWTKLFDLNASGIGAYYTDMQFMNESVGYVVGSKAFIGKTTDGGKTWRKLDSGVDATGLYTDDVFTCAHFLDENEGWVAGWGRLLHTEDGGATWTDHMPTDPDLHLPSPQDVYFSDRLHGVVVGMYNRVLYTEDAGETWNQPVFDFDPELYKTDHYRVYLLEGGQGWIGGTTVFLRTLDSGKTWNRLESSTAYFSSTSNLQFLDAENGYASGNGIAKTTDGGATWTTPPPTESKMGGTLHAFSTQHVVAGPYGKVLSSYRESTDGALTSHALGGTTTMDIRAVSFVSPNLGWSISPLGLISQFTR